MESRWAVPWREAFGMTETGVDLIVPIEDVASVGTGDLGSPVPSKRIKIVTDDGTEAGPGERGELLVAGQPMMLGYWNRPEESARVLRDGWLHTGDLACRGTDGRLRIVGRIKDMVRRGGENISSSEVEGALLRHPMVITAAVIPVPDDVRGEEMAAVVRLQQTSAPSAATADELRSVVRTHLADFKVPRYVRFVDEVPTTPSGKVDKQRLAAAWPQLRESAHDVEGPHRPSSPDDGADVLYTLDQGVATITLNRPAVLNALRHRTIDQLEQAITASAADPDVRVLVITGAGRGFCAGQDLDELADRLDADDATDGATAQAAALRILEQFQQITRLLLAHPVPTVAAINGVAIGAGAELAVACDIRLGSTAARIGFVEAARGLFQTNGVTWLLPRIIGLSRATELLVTAEILDATGAERFGLLNRVFPEAQFGDGVRDFTRAVSANAPLSVSQVVDIVRHTYELDLEAAMTREVAATARCMASDDLREGTRAFQERRPPEFRGR
jgi:enoyl-CoA hydratase/carnithine racemase